LEGKGTPPGGGTQKLPAYRGQACLAQTGLFAGSERGGRAVATFFTIIESARRNSPNPFKYLRDILERLPSHPNPISRYDNLLPNRSKPSPTTCKGSRLGLVGCSCLRWLFHCIYT
jgi:hypothetical protein